MATSYEHLDAYWLGRFSTQCAMTLKWVKKHPEQAEGALRDLLREYLRSPVPTADEQRSLREEMRRRA